MDHEEEFLSNFFTLVSQLCLDKAKESVEKEKEQHRSVQMGPWGMLLTDLPQIAVAERSYADLGFLHTKNKGFLRKDNSLRTIYEASRTDLRRVEEMSRGTNPIGVTVAEVSGQLCQFVTARIQLIDFYEKMYNMGASSKPMKYQELLQVIKGIVDMHSLSCSHLALIAIKTALTLDDYFSLMGDPTRSLLVWIYSLDPPLSIRAFCIHFLECEILVELLNAQIEVQNWRFLPSLMALYGAQTRMSAWERTLQSKESWKFGFGANLLKANQQPALYQWLVKLKNSILAKCSLYFHVTLIQQGSSGEMRSIMSKQSIDYYHKMQTFQRKHDLIAVLIVFHASGVDSPGPGYTHPKRDVDTSEEFLFMVSCPSVYMQNPCLHWNSIHKAMKERHADLLSMDKIIYTKSLKDQCTYAMNNIDPRTTLVVVFDTNKQRDKDTHVVTFMQEICVQLRCSKIYESLKLSK